MGRWRALGARSKADHAVVLCARAGLRPETLVEIGCGDGALLAELGARGLAPVLDGFELSPTAAALARDRDDRGRAPDRGLRRRARAGARRRLRPRGALARGRARRGPGAAAARGRARRARRCWSRSRSRPTAPPAGRRSARRRRGSATSSSSTARRVHALVAGAGLQVAAELSDPLPYAHHAFFASLAARAGAGGAQDRRAARALGRLAARGRAALHRPLRLPRAAALAWRA